MEIHSMLSIIEAATQGILMLSARRYPCRVLNLKQITNAKKA
eukprot:CAMPEP_0204177874 /NCGR_PEP_ID=MMETSP0361-20130328/48833_1 /ASSEMBLY_ACC=CAM_ASM_000343 /TAXON_ID=268821 /ORGANISM="Scrippsiella Hangoei, Strain SHTV-5" /LENGTH=41 /DNA_ID= /DNA_START= /DNA_END= /DNA_ORIENTATION=